MISFLFSALITSFFGWVISHAVKQERKMFEEFSKDVDGDLQWWEMYLEHIKSGKA